MRFSKRAKLAPVCDFVAMALLITLLRGNLTVAVMLVVPFRQSATGNAQQLTDDDFG